MYRLDAEVEETKLFREPRALGCWCPERSEGARGPRGSHATKGPRGSLNCVASETTHLTGLDYCAHNSWDLSASKAVDEAIKKARRAFFAFGAMGAFQGQLNPVSTRSIYETCVVPVLLFGSENWILTDSMLGEIGRRMLKLSKYHSTLSTRLALKWPSITARIFIRKLSLLSKACQEGNNIGNKIFSSFNQDSLRLTQEC